MARLPFRGLHIWRLIFTTCINSTGAPFMDDSFINDQEGNMYVGKAFLLRPWLKNEHGEHLRQRAFVVGWQSNLNRKDK